MTTTESDLTGLRVKVIYYDPQGISDYYVTGTVLAQVGVDLIRVETDEDEEGATSIVLAYLEDTEVIVPTVLLANETDPPDDSPLLDPDAVDGVYRLEF
jgi:hypothetical protein